MSVWIVCLLIVSFYALPLKANAFRFTQQPNLSQQDQLAVIGIAPWVKKLKSAIEKDPQYSVSMKKLHDQSLKYRFKPVKGSSLIETEIVWSTGNTEDDSLIKTLVKRAVSSTIVPQN